VTRYFVDIGDETFEVVVSGGAVTIDGESVDADFVRVEGTDTWSLLLDGESYRVVADRPGSSRWDVRFDGSTYRTRIVDERTRHIEELTGAGVGDRGPEPIRAPMPGLVVKIEVAEGDVVEPGQGVVIVEAMKMENELEAPTRARVGKIHVSEGEAVEKDMVLIDMVAVESEEDEA